jgi:RNA polymerase sigma-70 factor (ECF subfamily)
MLENESAVELFRRVRGGDGEAAAELVRRYEPTIRRRIRVWLRMQDPRLRRVFDSVDVGQSVLASFFLRAAAGQYDLDHPEQLVALLVRMACNKLAHEVARQQARRRDIRRDEGGGDTPEPADRTDSPSGIVAGRELLAELRRRLTEEERQLADCRAEGKEWTEIAAALGGTPEGRRKQLARALDRVTGELGLDDGESED